MLSTEERSAQGHCYCGSSKLYQACCQLFISGATLPDTPEQLMRSRYTAYCLNDWDYICHTWHPDFSQDISPFNLQETMSDIKWQQLIIVGSENLSSEAGTVTFEAHYKAGDSLEDFSFTEKSSFVKQDEKWLYTEGTISQIPSNVSKIDTDNVYSAPDKKLGRNDPCSCGSGRKFKKCCL